MKLRSLSVRLLGLVMLLMICKVQPAQYNIAVGVVLDMDTLVAKLCRICISMAHSDFYESHNATTKLAFHWRNSKEDIIDAASVALGLVTNEQVQAIIGPQTSAQARFVGSLGEKAHVPIVSFSASSPLLSTNPSRYLIRTTYDDSTQVRAIAAIVQAFHWRQVVVVYENTNYGHGIVLHLIDALQEIDARVSYRSLILTQATDNEILEELYKLKTMQTRVFVVHMLPSLGARLFMKAKEAGMICQGYAWITTNGLANELDSMNSSVIDPMQGVLSVRPYVPKSRELDRFTVRWRREFRRMYPDLDHEAHLNIFGLWAYDTVWALAMAAEKIGSAGHSFKRAKNVDNSSELSSVGVSETGPKLLEAFLSVEFKGLAGEFRLVSGRLQSGAYEIVNVIGKGGRTIGYWEQTDGVLTRGVDGSSEAKKGLGPIIWPGESTAAPRGWAVPTSGKKLRIGVPIKKRFTEFVKVEIDPDTNATKVTGFCKDVFDLVVEALPYALLYDLVPIQGIYDDLVHLVHLQELDAAIGDFTIVSNRSQYVDFTLPYSESSVAMVVPVRDDNKNNAWTFLQPLTGVLWLTTGAAFIFTGFVVWVLEHRINEEFRGPPAQQVGAMLWFSFSTVVFAYKYNLVNNWSRFVVTIWVFVVLILTSSYTANLTSMLTAQRLRPAVSSVKELVENGDYVGHQNSPFMGQWLRNLGFKETQLRAYRTSHEFAEALSKGSRNGGIAAIFDEIPYIQLFLKTYCDRYMMVGPTFKTGGFGFVFPMGSLLVSDVSGKILEVKEGKELQTIEQKWFGAQTTCAEKTNSISSYSLSLDGFWGLFLITGLASTSALAIHLALFVCEHRHVLSVANAGKPLWQRMLNMGRYFDRKDLSSHTVKKPEINEETP